MNLTRIADLDCEERASKWDHGAVEVQNMMTEREATRSYMVRRMCAVMYDIAVHQHCCEDAVNIAQK